MLTITDMFCGAGGSSTGLLEIPGVTVKTAMNHWERAVETHSLNHPSTDHVLADIQVTDPRYVASSDILWASPECTNHSVAKGRKRITNQPDLFGDSIADEAAEKSRATMWDVPRFAEQHKYKLIITENVVDAAKWVMFDAWLMAMSSLGYNHHIVYMNSMHAQLGGLPAPQSRDRMYVMFWLKGNPRPDFDKLRPMAYCPTCDETVRAMQIFKKPNERWGRYRAQYNYRCPNSACRNQIIEPGWLPAAHAIDWSIRGQRIGDRARPLADKTMARIRAGLEKYGQTEPFLSLMRSGRARNYSTSDTLQTLTTEGAGHCMVDPVGLAIDAVRGSNIITRTDDPFATQTTSYTRGLLVPVEGRIGKWAQASDEVMRTQTTRNETGLLTTPGHHMLMEYYGNGVTHPVSRAIPTIPTVDRFAMVTTMRGTAENQLENSSRPASDPLGTLTAGGNHHGLTEWTTEDINQCEFRMLEPHEIMAGMAFPKTYQMTGNKREQVKQSGNSVTPPAARDLGTIAVESLLAA
ncbi:DNA cytosine methyltransferase [Arthrobacter sp. MYb214]|uniref:DNA cytosine methyltransferase n=1 Tax=Arthrobacter sp. MYb214 TaxID=1848596 RepID=UPI002570DDB3|nr:DNA cytosine methyltransferase [Arthrobacter sp. MYb214]